METSELVAALRAAATEYLDGARASHEMAREHGARAMSLTEDGKRWSDLGRDLLHAADQLELEAGRIPPEQLIV